MVLSSNFIYVGYAIWSKDDWEIIFEPYDDIVGVGSIYLYMLLPPVVSTDSFDCLEEYLIFRKL